MQGKTIQSVIKLFDNLIKTPLAKMSIPEGRDRIFPVASLSSGKLLLSDGNIRQTPAIRKMNEIVDKNFLEGNNVSPRDYITNLSLNIAVPAKKTNDISNLGENSFVEYLNKVLEPKLSAPAEVGLPSVVPSIPPIKETLKDILPSAIANLPKLNKSPESIQATDNFFNSFQDNSSSLFDALQREFAKISAGETEANVLQKFARLPLVGGYESTYRIPTQQNAQYANISQNPFVLTGTVR